MLRTVILKNNYQDSINLMLLTNRIDALNGVTISQIMMGTDANKDILSNTNLLTNKANSASANDMMIVADNEKENIMEEAMPAIDGFLNDLSAKGTGEEVQAAASWSEAFDLLPETSVALPSIPGEYGAPEMERVLKDDLHVFSFMDNMSIEGEVRLKKLAHKKGLLMIGPDCGTGVTSSILVAFTSVVSPGSIDVVGVSGTGIREITTIINRLGNRVVRTIGTDGHDLSDKIGTIAVRDAIVALENHEPTGMIIAVSKPPAKGVRDEAIELLQSISEPIVAIFLGEKPTSRESKVYLTHTLGETTKIAVGLANDVAVKKSYFEALAEPTVPTLPEDKVVKDLCLGGTLASEAGILVSEALDLDGLVKAEGYVSKSHGYEVIDLGDDMYAQGRPHPMINSDVHIKKTREYAQDEETGIILFGVVLDYGAHKDMVGALLPAIEEARATAEEAERDLYFIVTVYGTAKDPQNYQSPVDYLREGGVLVAENNAKAAQLALLLKGIEISENDKEVIAYNGPTVDVPEPDEKVMELLTTKPGIISVGLQSFTESIVDHGGETVQFSWRPHTNGNKKMIKILDALEDYSGRIEAENHKVIDRIKDAQPFLVDVIPAKSVIPELSNDAQKTLLHAGPSIQQSEMTGPMKGACIDATLFRRWTDSEEDALKIFEADEVRFISCHHVEAVGPMGGTTSGNMPAFVVENRLGDDEACCILNEGIGKVLRFGACSQGAVDRLDWAKDVLGPTITKALRLSEEGLDLNVLIARSVTVGDEFHQRSTVVSLNFLKELSPLIIKASIPEDQKYEVIKFLADTDQFFSNVMTATGKTIVDGARRDTNGTIVTTMIRNGVDFGVRIAETSDRWHTAPANASKGPCFTGFSEEGGNPDIEDSAITEAVDVRAMAVVAVSGVARFVGADGFEDVLAISSEMTKICEGYNPTFSIPTRDFQGTCLGIDTHKVVELGITPIINTEIARKDAGVGQIGAGTVRAPLGCFRKALEAYAEKLGITVE